MNNNDFQKTCSIYFIHSIKKIAVLLLVFFLMTETKAQIGIGINPPDPSAMLHVQDTAKGLLIPRMTGTQRIAIVNPAEGLLVYQIDEVASGFWYFTNGQWKSLSALNNGGLHTIYLTDNITNAQAITKIATEYGPNTQEIRIVSCSSLTTVDLSMFTKLAEVYMNGNAVLQSVNLSNLQTLDGGIYIEQCPALTTMPASQLQKIGQSAYGGYGLSVNNSGITAINFPSLTVLGGAIDIQNNNTLTSVNIPLITQHGYPNSLPVTITKNNALTSISFAALQSVRDLKLDYNHSMTTINFPVLATANDLYINNTASLASLSFPALTTASIFSLRNDTALSSLSVPLLNYTTILFFMNNNATTSLSFPSLVTSGILSVQYCPALSSALFPSLASTCFYMSNNAALTSLSFPSLTTITMGSPTTPSHCMIEGNANLISINLGNLINYSGISLMFDYNKLPSAQVNYLLSKFVGLTPTLTMRSISLNQTPAAPPTGQGLIDKAALVANGNNVQTD